MENRVEYKFIKENEELVLLEHDNFWKQDIVRAIGRDNIIKWLQDRIDDCKNTIGLTNNGKANKMISDLKRVYERLLMHVRNEEGLSA